MNVSLHSSRFHRWRAALGSRLARALAWGAVAGALAAIVRYGLIQPEFFRNACDPESMPGWCWPRQIVVLASDNWLFGVASFALGVWAVLRPSSCRGAALAAVVIGAVGLALYDAEFASVGLVFGLIAAARA